MAGTDSSQSPTATDRGPAIVLVSPQLGENVGAAARAMLNCGLEELRLVSPRDGWPNPDAWRTASGADAVLDRARCFDHLTDAVADLHCVLATSARRRDMVKREVDPTEAAEEIRARAAVGERCGVLFGRERIGLTNDEVALADALVHVPLNPAFASLNLAQAVLLVAWEWRRSGPREPLPVMASHEQENRQPATREQLLGFFEHFEAALDEARFFKVDAMRPSQVRNLRNLFQRARLTDQDVRSLHGVVTALVGRRKDQL